MMKKIEKFVKSWWFGAAVAGAAGLVAWIFSPFLAGIGAGVAATMLVQGIREQL